MVLAGVVCLFMTWERKAEFGIHYIIVPFYSPTNPPPNPGLTAELGTQPVRQEAGTPGGLTRSRAPGQSVLPLRRDHPRAAELTEAVDKFQN